MKQGRAGSGGRPSGTPGTRANKLGDRIAEIVAEMLERRIKDPRLGFVTVTEARVTGDLREATVFYTVYGSDDDVAGTAAALASATGLIRSEVGRQTGLKHTPSISFSQDTVPDTVRTIEDLVVRARAADAEVAAARDGAVHAGDPDPYRVAGDGIGEEEPDAGVVSPGVVNQGVVNHSVVDHGAVNHGAVNHGAVNHGAADGAGPGEGDGIDDDLQ